MMIETQSIHPAKESQPSPWPVLLAFLATVLGLALIGYSAYQNQRDQARAHSEAQIRAIGEFRIEQISLWLRETRKASAFFSQGGQVADHFAAWAASGYQDVARVEKIRARLDSFQTGFGYHSVSLFDTAGIYRYGDHFDAVMAEHKPDALQAMRSRQTVLVDFHQHGMGHKEPMLGMITPLVQGTRPDAPVVGAMFVGVTAQTSLFRQLDRWPTPSDTGETVLVRKHGTQTEILYRSRNGGKPEARLQNPQPGQVGERLLRGEHGLLRGAVDYRGQTVLAFGGRVPGSDWILVAKQDQAEIDAPIARLALVSASGTGLLMLLSGLFFRHWWQTQRNRQSAQLLGKEIERRVLERRYDTLSHYAIDSILLLDDDSIILEINKRVELMYGYSEQELLGQSLFILLPLDRQAEFYQRRQDALAAGELSYQSEHVRRDGNRFPVDINMHVIELHGVRHFHLTVRDISERKLVETRLQMQALVMDQIQDTVTITDLDGVITYVNQALCRGSGLAREQLIGLNTEFFGSDPEADASQAEIGHATLTSGGWRGKIVNFDHSGNKRYIDLRTTLIRDDLGQPMSMVGIGTDISERIAGERAVQEREALYRGVIETSADGFWIVDMTGHVLEVNAAYCRRSGYSREELLGKRISDFEINEDPVAVTRHIEKMIREGGDLFESRHRAKDGSVWQVEVTASYSSLFGGRFFVFLRDIQRRNRADSLLRTRLQLSDLAFGSSLDELMQAALDMIELYTGSQIGFFHFVEPDQETLTLQAWSSNTLKSMCNAVGMGQHYPVSQAGVWADAVRTRASVIHNDYASLPDKKGMPEGHAQVVREMVVPILRSDKVVAVLGVGNKGVEYTGEDLETAQELASMVMEMVARKRAEEALYRANARLMQAQRITRLGDWELDLRTGKVNWSEQVYLILGLDPASEPPDLAAHRQLLHPEDYPQFEAEVNAALQFGTPYQNEVRAVRPDGEISYIWYTGQAVKDAEGKVERLFGTVQDITERKQSEAKLEQATHFDALTGLPNMRWLFKRMQQLIEAGTDSRMALLLMNIDRFAQLNESLGRSVGDLVLMTLAQRWSAALPDGCVLVRLAGDQFVILRTDFEDTESIIETAAGLIDATRQPIQLRPGEARDLTGLENLSGQVQPREGDTPNLTGLQNLSGLNQPHEGDKPDLTGLQNLSGPIQPRAAEKPVLLTVSIGIALYPNDAADANALLHAAEDAMRSAKADKGNQARFFDRKQAQASIDWFETEAALREALGRDEFFLLYQPQIDTATGRVSAVEALIRWRRDGKVVPPGNFIHVVEGTDLAEPVSRWVLQTACRQARQWMERQRPLRVAVNIFSAHVTSGRLLDDVSLALSSNRLPAHLLELEVVESSLLVNPELAAQTLRDLKRMGVGLALDDFGTGYSSLGYLKHYPFDELKIDQMFTRNVNRVPEDAAIVRSTIALAHNLGMRVLAEGVETESQLRFLARYGCDQMQGYLFSRPTEPAVVETAVMERSDLRPLNPQLQIRTNGVLVLEDELVEQMLMRDLLEDAGYRVYIAANLDSAITLMGTEAIDVIVSDYYLEKETGVDILERISRFYPEVPSIVVSGSSEQSVVVEAINRAAIRGFLAKPVQPELLLRLLRSIFDAAAAHERV